MNTPSGITKPLIAALKFIMCMFRVFNLWSSCALYFSASRINLQLQIRSACLSTLENEYSSASYSLSISCGCSLVSVTAATSVFRVLSFNSGQLLFTLCAPVYVTSINSCQCSFGRWTKRLSDAPGVTDKTPSFLTWQSKVLPPPPPLQLLFPSSSVCESHGCRLYT